MSIPKKVSNLAGNVIDTILEKKPKQQKKKKTQTQKNPPKS